MEAWEQPSTSELFHEAQVPCFPELDVDSLDDPIVFTETPLQALQEDEIRLVKILPETDGTTINCETVVRKAKGCESYTALSYTWGSQQRREETIIVNGKKYPVAKNLWRFLKQAAQLGDRFSGWLWIDALSIEQSNLQEKLEQVKIISETFRQAKEVIVWLGPKYADSDVAIRELRSQRCCAGHKTHYQKIPASPAGSAIRSLCERRYWSRLWVVQELWAAQSTQIMCGDRLIPLQYFEQFLQPLLHDDSDKRMPRLKNELQILQQSPAAKAIKLIRTVGHTYTVIEKRQITLDRSLWTLLHATRELQCAEPRDRVYALLSVASAGHQGIKPNYQRPLTELIKDVLVEKLDSAPLKGAGEVEEDCNVLKELFIDSVSNAAFWNGLARCVRPGLCN